MIAIMRRFPLTRYAAEGAIKFALLQILSQWEREGLSLNQSARLLGVPASSLSVWRSRYKAEGLAGLTPTRWKAGRKPQGQRHRFPPRPRQLSECFPEHFRIAA